MTEIQKSKLVARAQELIGTPYRYGAALEDAPTAFDCSSFVQYLFKTIGIELPRSALLQAGDARGAELPLLGPFQPGDLLFMRSDRGHYKDELFGGRRMDIGHVALFIGNGNVINAKASAGGVVEQPLHELTSDPNYAIIYAKRY